MPADHPVLPNRSVAPKAQTTRLRSLQARWRSRQVGAGPWGVGPVAAGLSSVLGAANPMAGAWPLVGA